MKYKRFKLGQDNEIGSADILVHIVKLLDHAAEVAVVNNDTETILAITDKLMSASEQLIALGVHEMEYASRMHEQEGEEEIVTSSESRPFGFQAEYPSEGVGGEEIE